MITAVALKNWRSHLESRLSFSEGTNCFVGSIGSGKTSILDAICFALFGTFPLLQQKKLKLEDVVMKKPKKQSTAEVEVVFEVNGDTYKVRRKIEKGRTSQAEIVKNNEFLETQSQKVTEEIEKILKIDYELFTRAVYSEQNQLDMFLTIPKGQRMKRIDQLLELDRFESARASTVAITNSCKSSIMEKQNIALSLEKDESLRNLDIIRKEIENLESDKEKLRIDLINAKKSRASLSEKLNYLEKQEKELQRISEKTASVSAVSRQISSDIAEIEKSLDAIAVEDLEKEIENKSVEIRDLEENIEAEQRNLSLLKQELADNSALAKLIYSERLPDLEAKLKEKKDIEKLLKRKSIEQLIEKFKESSKNLEEHQLELQVAVVKISELEKSIKGLSTTKEKCPVCDSKLTEEKKKELIKQKKDEIEDLDKEHSKLETKIEKLKETVEELRDSIEELERLEEKLKDLGDVEADIEKQKKDYEKLASEVETNSNEIKMLEKVIQNLDKGFEKYIVEQEQLKQKLSKRAEYDKKEKFYRELKEEITQLEKMKEELETTFSREVVEKLRREQESVIETEKSIEAKLDNISTIENEKKKRVQELENKKQALDSYKLEIRKLEALTDQLELLESALAATQEQLRKNFISVVNQAMHEIWQNIYPYGDFFSIRLGIDGDYVLQLQDSTGWISADIVSGGERSIACLALRIAFALVLAPQLRWLVLDEPTHNLDAKAVDVLATVLRERINEFVEQVFLITHDPSLESAVSGYLYRLEREKGRDDFTRVVCITGPES